MGVFLSTLLIIVGTVSIVYGVHFFWKEKNSGYLRRTMLLLGLSAGIWQIGYGFLGLNDNDTICLITRRIALIGVSLYPLTETVLALRKTGISKKGQYVIRSVLTILAITDWILFSGSRADVFIRVGNWTTFQAVKCPERTFHEIYVAIIFLTALGSWFLWFRKVKIRREKRLLYGILLANISIMVFALPDTILVRLLNYGFPTSGLGAGLSLMQWYLAAEKYNTFSISSKTMGSYVQNVVEEGIVIFDEELTAVEVNRFAREEMNIREKMDLTQILTLEQSAEEIFASLVEKSHIRFKSGMPMSNRIYMVEMTVAWDDYREPFGYIMTLTDITKEEQLVEEAESANQAKSNFLANMSHEIRTPMNTIGGMAEMIMRDSLDETARENAAMISAASNSLLAIINDILDLSKIESGKMEIVKESYQMASLLNDVRAMILFKMKGESKRLEVDIDPSFPCELIGDEIRIKQILINLLGNAVKFTSEGSITLRMDYRKEGEDLCRIQAYVKDTGIGIRQEDQELIFDSFTQVDTRKNRSEDGTGLGLAITKRLIHKMGGDIRVESVYGEGTTFYFDFLNEVSSWEPVGDLQESLKKVRTDPFRGSFTAEGAKILIVDDNSMNLRVAEGLLKIYKIRPVCVESGIAAVRCFERMKEFDLIFMDHMMPGMDGVEAMQKIRGLEGGKDTVIIALTANAISGAKYSYREAGFDDFLAKPIEPKKLDELLKKHLPKKLIRE